MNLDFSSYLGLDGPIVLLIGRYDMGQEDLKAKLYDDLILEANGQTVEIIHVLLDSYWWDDPTLPNKMHEILDLFPRKSKVTATKWIETDGFVQEVRELLTRQIEQETSLAELPANWPELVSLVILDVDAETSYVQRVFDGWFPNALFRANCGAGKTVPIWRNAEVTPITDALHPTDDLEKRCDQLGLQPPRIGRKLVNAGLTTLGALVVASCEQVWAVLGGNEADYHKVFEFVLGKGLELNMDERRVAELKQDGPWFIIRNALTPEARSERVTEAEFKAHATEQSTATG